MNTSMLGTLDEEHKIQYLFNLAKEHRDRVKTFSELFEDIKVQEKECKTMQKMTLKQLEAKKKERLLINPEGNNYSKPVRIQTEKYDKLKIIDNTSIFELYEASLNPKIKLSDHGRQWEEMLETDFKLMKANRAKTENESHLAVPVKQLSKSRRLSINMNALKVDDTIERNKTINDVKQLQSIIIGANAMTAPKVKLATHQSFKVFPAAKTEQNANLKYETSSAAKTVDLSNKIMKKSSSAIEIPSRKQKMRASYSTQKIQNSPNNFMNNSKFSKPRDRSRTEETQNFGLINSINKKSKEMLKPKDIDWISYSKLKQEFIPELQHFKHPDMYRTQVGYSYSIDQSGEIKDISKISSVKAFQNGSKTNNQKHERVNFLEQLDMKRKYFKSGYAIASPVKEFKSHNTDREVPVKSVMKSIDKKHGKRFVKGSVRDLISNDHINSIAFPSIKSSMQVDASRLTGATLNTNDEYPSQIKHNDSKSLTFKDSIIYYK